MKNKKFITIFLSVIILLTISNIGMAFQNQDLRMKVSIFQIPPYQSIVKSEPTPPPEKGGVGEIRGTMTGGYVTASFPDGIVLFESDISQSNTDIIKFIKDKTSINSRRRSSF